MSEENQYEKKAGPLLILPDYLKKIFRSLVILFAY